MLFANTLGIPSPAEATEFVNLDPGERDTGQRKLSHDFLLAGGVAARRVVLAGAAQTFVDVLCTQAALPS